MSRLFIRSAPLAGFRQSVHELGGNPDAILNKCGLSPLVLENPELVIPFEAYLRLLNITATETGCSYFGLLLSKHLDLSILGPIGLLLQQSDTVGDALRLFIQYFPTRFQGSEPELRVEGDRACLISHFKYAAEDLVQQMLLSGGVGITLMKSLCGESWKPIEIHSTRKRTEFSDIAARFYESPIRFARERNQMVFAASDLTRKIPGRLGQFERYLQPLVNGRENQLSSDIISLSESLIRALLPEGKCSLETIAVLLYSSERSLQRNLRARGTSFRQLVEKVRKSVARQHLRHSDISMSQLAFVLGYTEPSTFTRAFKRWFGVAPSKWDNPFGERDRGNQPQSLAAG